MFSAIKDSRAADHHIKSRCCAGEYLCEEWGHILLRELEEERQARRPSAV
jgi:hypothetical protein